MIERGYEDFAERWNPILDVFDAEGVRFAHEVHPSEIAYDYWTTHRALEAIDHRPAFGLNFDPSHFVWQDLDPVGFLCDFRDRIYHVHCKEARKRLDGRNGRLGCHLPWGDPRRGWDFVSAGHGDVPWEDVFRMLRSIGYDGPALGGVGGRGHGPAGGRAGGAAPAEGVRLRPAVRVVRRGVQLLIEAPDRPPYGGTGEGRSGVFVLCGSGPGRVRDEARPGGGGEGELGALGVLGVADVDGVGAGGDLDAVVAVAAAVAGLVPGEGDFDAVVARDAAVAALEPGQFGGAHSAPRIRFNRLTESSGERACERILAYRIWSTLILFRVGDELAALAGPSQ